MEQLLIVPMILLGAQVITMLVSEIKDIYKR